MVVIYPILSIFLNSYQLSHIFYIVVCMMSWYYTSEILLRCLIKVWWSREGQFVNDNKYLSDLLICNYGKCKKIQKSHYKKII